MKTRPKESISSKRRWNDRSIQSHTTPVKKVKLTNYDTHKLDPVVRLQRQSTVSERPQHEEICSETKVAEKRLPLQFNELCNEMKMIIYNKLEQEDALNMRLVSKQDKDIIDDLYSFNIRLDDRKPLEVTEFLLNRRIRQLTPIHFFQPPKSLPLFKFPKFVQQYTFGHLDSISQENADISFQEYIKNCTTRAHFNLSNMEEIVSFTGNVDFSKVKNLHISASGFHVNPFEMSLVEHLLHRDVFLKLLRNVKDSTKDLREISFTFTFNYNDKFLCAVISVALATVLRHQIGLEVFKMCLASKRGSNLNFVPYFPNRNENRDQFQRLQRVTNLKEISVSSDNSLPSAFSEMLQKLLFNQQKLENLEFITIVKATVNDDFYKIKSIIEKNLNTLKYVILRIQKPVQKFLDYISTINFRGSSTVQTVRERVISKSRTIVYYELFFDLSNLKAAVQDSIIYLEIRLERKSPTNLEHLLTKQLCDQQLQNLKVCRILLNQPRPACVLEYDLVSRLFSLPKLLLIFISGKRIVKNQNPEGHSNVVESSEFRCKLMAFQPSENTWQYWHRLSMHDNFKEVSGPDLINEFSKLAKKAFRKVYFRPY